MPEVDVTINGRSYRVGCEAGQEERLSRLAGYVGERVEMLVSQIGDVGDARLLVMTSLMLADELAEAYATLSEAGFATPEDDDPQSAIAERKETVVDRVENAAGRIESIAEAITRS